MPRRHTEKVEKQLHGFLTSTPDAVSDQLHFLAGLTTGKENIEKEAR